MSGGCSEGLRGPQNQAPERTAAWGVALSLPLGPSCAGQGLALWASHPHHWVAVVLQYRDGIPCVATCPVDTEAQCKCHSKNLGETVQETKHKPPLNYASLIP